MDAERARRADGDAALDGPVPGSPTREPRRRRARTNPDDRRSLLVGLAPAGTRLLKRARPRFRVYAEAVESRLGQQRIGDLRQGLAALREAIEDEVAKDA